MYYDEDGNHSGIDVKIKMVNKSDNPLPDYAKIGDAGMDIRASEDVWVRPFNKALIPTGLYVELPYGYEIQIRSRSGLAWKHGLNVMNSPGTIDAGYRGEIKVILNNNHFQAYDVKKGDRVAQMVVAPVTVAKFIEVPSIAESERGEGGFGSTGK